MYKPTAPLLAVSALVAFAVPAAALRGRIVRSRPLEGPDSRGPA